MKYFLATCLWLLLTVTVYSEEEQPVTVPFVTIQTNFGLIEIELNSLKAPKTVENFLTYVKDGFYEGTIFHRVIYNFIIQGGGYDTAYKKKTTRSSIPNEANNGLKNLRGTVTMARSALPHSATSQFFINVKDNKSLDYKSTTPAGWGYCVFGKVVEGMEVIDKIANLPTDSDGPFRRDVPQTAVVIEAMKVEYGPTSDSMNNNNSTLEPPVKTNTVTKNQVTEKTSKPTEVEMQQDMLSEDESDSENTSDATSEEESLANDQKEDQSANKTPVETVSAAKGDGKVKSNATNSDSSSANVDEDTADNETDKPIDSQIDNQEDKPIHTNSATTTSTTEIAAKQPTVSTAKEKIVADLTSTPSSSAHSELAQPDSTTSKPRQTQENLESAPTTKIKSVESTSATKLTGKFTPAPDPPTPPDKPEPAAY